jgi:hypothetical protein
MAEDSRQPRQRAVSANSTKVSYRSYRSHSSSFEADDERSSSAESMGPDQAPHESSAQYAEDTRLTSRKELSGWYAYGWAAEVFVICGIGESRILRYNCHELLQLPHICFSWHCHRYSLDTVQLPRRGHHMNPLSCRLIIK